MIFSATYFPSATPARSLLPFFSRFSERSSASSKRSCCIGYSSDSTRHPAAAAAAIIEVFFGAFVLTRYGSCLPSIALTAS
jgi:hypothetical protein